MLGCCNPPVARQGSVFCLPWSCSSCLSDLAFVLPGCSLPLQGLGRTTFPRLRGCRACCHLFAKWANASCLLVVIGPSEVLTDLHSGLSRFSILNALDAERTLPRVENGREVLLCSEHKGPLRCHLSFTALIESCPRVSLSWVEFLAACLLSWRQVPAFVNCFRCGHCPLRSHTIFFSFHPLGPASGTNHFEKSWWWSLVV